MFQIEVCKHRSEKGAQCCAQTARKTREKSIQSTKKAHSKRKQSGSQHSESRRGVRMLGRERALDAFKALQRLRNDLRKSVSGCMKRMERSRPGAKALAAHHKHARAQPCQTSSMCWEWFQRCRQLQAISIQKHHCKCKPELQGLGSPTLSGLQPQSK